MGRGKERERAREKRRGEGEEEDQRARGTKRLSALGFLNIHLLGEVTLHPVLKSC